MKTLIALLILIPSLSFTEVNKENEQSSNTNEGSVVEKYFDEILEFAVSNSVSTLMHEIGHYYIDILDIPTFGQEEDMADSFIFIGVLLFLYNELIVIRGKKNV